ncbi:MAG: rRNA pseudouridine synthase [Bdellovibrionales bacterium]|nr:rRNA pseudouridine synthase [Bdellovibrionales bacterium]
MPIERLQKVLARAGIASRRRAEDMIRLGEVTINGRIAKIGDQADTFKDAIKVNGKLLTLQAKNVGQVYLAFHKPRGVISMMAPDPEGRPTIAHYLGAVKARVFPIGRLDYNGEGLILLTNDGTMAESILKSPDIIRTYQVRVKGHPAPEALDDLRKGAKLENKLVRPEAVEVVESRKSKSVIQVQFVGMGALDVKELFQAKRFLVERVVRTRFGHLSVERVPLGGFVFLKKSQLEALVRQPELGRVAPKPERQVQNKSGGRQKAEARRDVEAAATGRALREAAGGKPARSGEAKRPQRPARPAKASRRGPRGTRR